MGMTLLTSRKVYMDIALTLVATYKSTRTPPESEVRICITCSGGFIRPDALLVASDLRFCTFRYPSRDTHRDGSNECTMWESESWSVEGGHREEGRDGRHEGEPRWLVLARDLRRYSQERNKEPEQVSNSIFQIQGQRESENESLMQADGPLQEKVMFGGKAVGRDFPDQKERQNTETDKGAGREIDTCTDKRDVHPESDTT